MWGCLRYLKIHLLGCKYNFIFLSGCRLSVREDYAGTKQVEVSLEGWDHEPEWEGLRFSEGQRRSGVVKLKIRSKNMDTTQQQNYLDLFELVRIRWNCFCCFILISLNRKQSFNQCIFIRNIYRKEIIQFIFRFLPSFTFCKKKLYLFEIKKKLNVSVWFYQLLVTRDTFASLKPSNL